MTKGNYGAGRTEAYRSNSDVCSAHYIREKAVDELGLEGLRRLLWYIWVYEKQFAQEQTERFGLQKKKELTAKRRELDRTRQEKVEGRCRRPRS